MIKTSHVEGRRTLRFEAMQDILADLEFLDSGDPPTAIGNWTAGQVVQHVTKLIVYSVEGFPGKAPLPLRLIGRFILGRTLTRRMSPGLKLPSRMSFMKPNPDIGWEASVDAARAAIEQAERMRMSHASPIFGRLTHEQWVQLHCRHAEMHFSFLQPAE